MRRLLTVKEAAQYLGLATGTLYNLVSPKAKKKLPIRVKRVGGAVRFDIKDLDAYSTSRIVETRDTANILRGSHA